MTSAGLDNCLLTLWSLYMINKQDKTCSLVSFGGRRILLTLDRVWLAASRCIYVVLLDFSPIKERWSSLRLQTCGDQQGGCQTTAAR